MRLSVGNICDYYKSPAPLSTQVSAMRVMFTVFYLTIGFNGLSLSARLCPQDPGTFSMDQLETIVYALANEKGVVPSVIINRLLRKIKIRQRNEKARPKTQLQEIALDELINSDSQPRSPPKSGGPKMRQDRVMTPMSKSPLPPSPDRGPSMPGPFYPPPLVPVPQPPEEQGNNVMTGMMVPPGFPPQMPRMVPQSIFIPFPNISPPPGVTIRIKAGNSINKIPEVTITLSPMMTIVEALKQAESKFRSVLRPSLISDEEELISFSYSSYAECYVIRSLDGVESDENGFWKIIVSEISGKLIYDSVCLPSRDEVPVKPGMTITLLFTIA